MIEHSFIMTTSSKGEFTLMNENVKQFNNTKYTCIST